MARCGKQPKLNTGAEAYWRFGRTISKRGLEFAREPHLVS